MPEERIRVVPFDMKYLDDYFRGFNAEITKYQWPEPFLHVKDAEALLLEFLGEMQAGETRFYAVLSKEGTFFGSVEVHGLSEDRPELGVWIIESEQGKGYAYDALNIVLNDVCSNYHKTEFYYEADIRNIGSMKLLQKFGDKYEIIKQKLEEVVTGSGKELMLQGYVLRRKREAPVY
ncbi:MAG: GNAT family N-acetyltransferase [Oscillospiraceae bacterium]|nr:GNAT family N-acetyltransferase [Oscillospiraceae bacterium]